MKEMDEIQKVSQLYKVLSDPTRLRILSLLKSKELNVSMIGEQLNMEQSAVSHQLKLLRENNVVKPRREGKTIFYSLHDHHVIDLLNQTFEHIKHQWNSFSFFCENYKKRLVFFMGFRYTRNIFIRKWWNISNYYSWRLKKWRKS